MNPINEAKNLIALGFDESAAELLRLNRNKVADSELSALIGDNYLQVFGEPFSRDVGYEGLMTLAVKFLPVGLPTGITLRMARICHKRLWYKWSDAIVAGMAPVVKTEFIESQFLRWFDDDDRGSEATLGNFMAGALRYLPMSLPPATVRRMMDICVGRGWFSYTKTVAESIGLDLVESDMYLLSRCYIKRGRDTGQWLKSDELWLMDLARSLGYRSFINYWSINAIKIKAAQPPAHLRR